MIDNTNIRRRRSIRLKGYDYSQAGLYFITICVQDRKCLFGKIETNEMMLNDFGIVANEQWEKLAERFTNFELDVYQIMPNHMHGIILLTENVGAGLASAQNENITDDKRAGVNPAPTNKTIGDIVGAYKSLVANACLEIHKRYWTGMNPATTKIPMMGKLWQRNYYENIIRDEQSYQHISEYIINNPKNWKGDKFHND